MHYGDADRSTYCINLFTLFIFMELLVAKRNQAPLHYVRTKTAGSGTLSEHMHGCAAVPPISSYMLHFQSDMNRLSSKCTLQLVSRKFLVAATHHL